MVSVGFVTIFLGAIVGRIGCFYRRVLIVFNAGAMVGLLEFYKVSGFFEILFLGVLGSIQRVSVGLIIFFFSLWLPTENTKTTRTHTHTHTHTRMYPDFGTLFARFQFRGGTGKGRAKRPGEKPGERPGKSRAKVGQRPVEVGLVVGAG